MAANDTLRRMMTEAHGYARHARGEYASYAEAFRVGLVAAHTASKAAPAAKENKMEIRIVVTSDFGTLSRGRHSARQGNGNAARWAAKDGKGNLVITEAGEWRLHCSDGFRREARATLVVQPDGDWRMTGETRRFDIIES